MQKQRGTVYRRLVFVHTLYVLTARLEKSNELHTQTKIDVGLCDNEEGCIGLLIVYFFPAPELKQQ